MLERAQENGVGEQVALHPKMNPLPAIQLLQVQCDKQGAKR